MDTLEKAKVKNDLSSKSGKRYWKYIRPILFILILYLSIHVSLFIYSRNLGEWASMSILDAPPVGELLLDTTVQEMGYFNKVMLYRLDMDLKSAYKLFDDEYVMMLLIDGILLCEEKEYRSAIIAPNSFEYKFLYL